MAWLLNLRGADVDYNPIFISYVIVTPDAATLYVDSAKVGTICQNTSPANDTHTHCMRISVKGDFTSSTFSRLIRWTLYIHECPRVRWCLTASSLLFARRWQITLA